MQKQVKLLEESHIMLSERLNIYLHPQASNI